MKLVCDCGNEANFNTIDEETKKEYDVTDDEGQYCTIKNFRMWETCDTVGIVCEKCGKAIWLFV